MDSKPTVLKTWRVLLADDHAMVREALSHMLERLDPTLEVKHAGDLPQALEVLAADSNFTFLLLDYNMPGMNGARSIIEIRGKYPALAVGVISGYLPPKTVEPLIGAGAVGVFPKTMSGPSLIMALKLALAGQVYVPWTGELQALGVMAPEDDADELRDMTSRQMRILSLIVSGEANKAIARDLGLSEVTIKVQVAALCRKFSVNNRTQLATAAVRAGVKGDTA